MSTIVIMPGGFHPFHAGHAALYNSAKRTFPDADVYVAATDDTSTRPFPFQVKEKLAQLAGVDKGRFMRVKSPFQAKEITAPYNPEVDQLIFVRSEKDADKPPQAGGVKKDGSPAYLQPLLDAKKLEPFGRHAYMAYLPTVEFGPGMTSATEIRTAWPTLNEKRKTALVMSLYPATQKNPALAANVVKMLDTAIGGEELKEDSQVERKISRVLAMIQNYHDRARATKNDIKKNHYLQMADQLQSELDRLINDANEQERDSNMINQHDSEPSDTWNRGGLMEFAPDEGGGSRKFIPWPEFIDAVKQIVGKDFDVVENVVKSTIKARFVPHDPMEYGPTMLYSYYEARAGRDKGAVSTRGSIQVGKYVPNTSQLGTQNYITSFNLLKGHPFERHFDLTFDNIYKIANIIMGNTEGAYQMQVAEGELNEVGNTFYDVDYTGTHKPSLNSKVKREKIGLPKEGTSSFFEFSTESGTKYKIELIQNKLKQGGQGVNVLFTNETAKRSGDNSIGITNDGDAIKVFSTVKAVLAKYLSEHPEIIIVGFSAKTAEPSRVKLYQTFAKQFQRWFPKFTNFKSKTSGDFTTFGVSIPQTKPGVAEEVRGAPPQQGAGMTATWQRKYNQPPMESHTVGYIQEEDPDYIEEKWSEKYKRSIDCSNPKGFSQKAHCAGRKK